MARAERVQGFLPRISPGSPEFSIAPARWEVSQEFETMLFSVERGDYDRLLAKAGVAVSKTKHVADTIFDTEDGTLAEKGMSLRIRTGGKTPSVDIQKVTERSLVKGGLKYRLPIADPDEYASFLTANGLMIVQQRSKHVDTAVYQPGSTPIKISFKEYDIPGIHSVIELESSDRLALLEGINHLEIPCDHLASYSFSEHARRCREGLYGNNSIATTFY